jgi:hypothetical protein
MILVYHESGECGSSVEWTLLAPPAPAVPAGPYGMLMSAPPGPTLPIPAHGVPSMFTHGGGGGGSAIAGGAAAIAAAAAPAKSTGMIFDRFAIM